MECLIVLSNVFTLVPLSSSFPPYFNRTSLSSSGFHTVIKEEPQKSICALSHRLRARLAFRLLLIISVSVLIRLPEVDITF